MQKDKVVTKVFEDYYYIEDDWIYANDGQFIAYRWVETRWNPANKKHYEGMGYKFTNHKDSFDVEIEDLSNGSHAKVLRRCPMCGNESSMQWCGLVTRVSTYCSVCSRYNCAYTTDEVNTQLSQISDQRLRAIGGVIYPYGSNKAHRECVCECGNNIMVNIYSLTSGHTRSCGCLQRDVVSTSGENNVNWRGGSIRSYGQTWSKQARLARDRDNNTCQRCNITKEEQDRNMDVHHKVKFRSFNYIQGENRNDIVANNLDNLICLCSSCHHIVEKNPEAINDFRNGKGEIEYGA